MNGKGYEDSSPLILLILMLLRITLLMKVTGFERGIEDKVLAVDDHVSILRVEDGTEGAY